MSSENPFQRFWNLGYRSLISIIPAKGPAAGYAAKSASYLGKAPGYFDEAAGLWRGRRNWQHYEATKTDLVRWFEQGANVGLRLEDLLAIDIDASDPATAGKVEQMALAALGPSPCRIGRAPRRMLLYRLSAPMRYTIISFDHAGENEKIEFSTGKRQMVVYGTHAKTGKLYEWTRELVARDELTVVTPQQVESLVRDLRAVLPPSVLSVEGGGTDRAKVNQDALRGPADHVRAAIEALPNSNSIYPTRDDYIRVGVALKAALEDDNEAFELWCDWAAKYDDGGQPELWSKDWRGIKPPYEIGAGWLYDQAAKVAGWTGKDNAIAATSFTATQVDASDMFGEKPEELEPPVRISATPLRQFNAAELPKRQWLYGDHYIRKYVSTTAAPTAVGKSSLIMVEAMAMVVGKPLLGVEPKGRFRVWVWNGEDPIEELELRMAAIMQHYGVTHEDLGGRLFLDSGRMTEIVVATAARDGARIAVPVVAAVVATLRENRIDVGVLDPFVSTYRGPETNDMFDPIVKQWGTVAGATNTAIELVHHTRKLNGAETTVEDTRGGGALIAGARSKRVLARMSVAEAKKFGVGEDAHRRYFRIADASVNMALPAILATQWFEMHSVAIGNGEGSTSVDRMMSGDSVGVATLRVLDTVGATVGRDDKAAVLELIRAGEWRRDVRAGDAWIGVPIAQALGLDIEDGAGKASVRQIVGEWLKSGLLKEVSRKDAGRKTRTYVECNATYVEHFEMQNGVFE